MPGGETRSDELTAGAGVIHRAGTAEDVPK